MHQSIDILPRWCRTGAIPLPVVRSCPAGSACPVGRTKMTRHTRARQTASWPAFPGSRWKRASGPRRRHDRPTACSLDKESSTRKSFSITKVSSRIIFVYLSANNTRKKYPNKFIITTKNGKNSTSSINQSINRTIDRPINQSINQSIDLTTNHPIPMQPNTEKKNSRK